MILEAIIQGFGLGMIYGIAFGIIDAYNKEKWANAIIYTALGFLLLDPTSYFDSLSAYWLQIVFGIIFTIPIRHFTIKKFKPITKQRWENIVK